MTGVVGTADDQSVIVSWTAPADYGVMITEYVVTESVGSLTAVVSGSPASPSLRFPSLTNGVSYAFTVVPTNAAGSASPSSASAGVVPRGGCSVYF